MENPYASPQSAETREDPESLLRDTTKLYRRMGWIGIAYIALVYPFGMISELLQRPPQIASIVGSTIICCLMLAFFVFMKRTAKKLESDFDRTYRRARWLGILVAVLFAPFLTIPGVLAVRRLARVRALRLVPTDE